MSKHHVPGLMDEPPISVYPSLAKAFGNVNLAIILQQLHFLLNVAELSKNAYVNVDGKWWVYNSYEEWRVYFPWLAEVTIRGLFNSLEEKGIVEFRQGVKDKFDRRKWYTINYEVYAIYIASNGYKVSDVHPIKNIASDGQKVSDVIKESETTYSETTQKKTRKRGKSSQSETLEQNFRTDYELYRPLAEALRSPFNQLDIPPELTPRTELEHYLIAAKELTPCGATVAEIPLLYTWLEKKAKAGDWSTFGVKAMVKYYTEFKAHQQRRRAASDIETVEAIPILEQALRDRAAWQQQEQDHE